MKKISRLIVTFALIFTHPITLAYGQESYQEESSYSPAYMQSRSCAHWSIYIPITLLVGAAIWFGIADRKHETHESSDSQDALGSIISTKRLDAGIQSSGSGGKFKRPWGLSKGSHGHH